MEKNEIIICECYSTEHQMVFTYSDDDGHPMIYIHIHLNKRPFLERIKTGIKYIFGHQSRYGFFDEFIVNPKDKPKFEEIVKYLDEKFDNKKNNN
jgi:hypothetical protein